MQSHSQWKPKASLDALRMRAEMLARIRDYFARACVLEVETPVLSPAGTTDLSIQSFKTAFNGPGSLDGVRLYLQTSPEYPMKRLLAAGSGSIYQICKVFRDGESGCRHNPEFTLLEWYRIGFDHVELMGEVELLLRTILEGMLSIDSVEHWSYRELFQELAGVDPFTAPVADLRAGLVAQGISPPDGLVPEDYDGWLDVLLTHVVEPRLGQGLVFIRDYPVSQAALARLQPGDPPVASRFEVYLAGVELANGYHELVDATEQQQRFTGENNRRASLGLEPVAEDVRLLAAMQSGLPDCAGVALGLDRLLMLASGTRCLDEVIAFPLDFA